MKSKNVKPVGTKKQRGPAATGIGQLIGVRIQPELMKVLDDWIEEQSDHVTRPEAIRRLISHVLIDIS